MNTSPTSRFPGQQQYHLVLLIVLALLLIGGSGLIYYVSIYAPNQLHSQATATSVAHMNNTRSAQKRLSATAEFATGVSQWQATYYVRSTAEAQATESAIVRGA